MPSMVWTCFQKTTAGPKCLLCNDLRKRRDSSTKTMWVHLKLKHQDIYNRLRGVDTSNKVSLKTVESTSKPPEMNLMAHYSQLLMSNYIMNSQFAPQLAQQPANDVFLQTVAFNKFVFDLYTRMFTNNYSPNSQSPTEIKQENNLNWPEALQASQNSDVNFQNVQYLFK